MYSKTLIILYVLFIAFIITYIVLINKVIKNDPTGYTEKYRTMSIISFMIGFVILLSGIIIFSQKDNEKTSSDNKSDNKAKFIHTLLYLLGGSMVTVLLFGIIYLSTYLSNKYKLESAASAFMLNSMLAIIGVISVFIY